MQPFDFGYAIGQLEKTAGIGDMARGTAGAIIGGNPLDPTQRGIAADMALYSNPISGTITGVNDMARHLYNGRFGSALGTAGMTALSFLPGVGGVLGKGIARGTRALGKTLGSPAVQRAGANMYKYVGAGGRAVQQGQQAITRGAQRIVPQEYAKMTMKAPIRSTLDAAIRNPATTAMVAGPMLLDRDPGAAAHNAAVGAPHVAGQAAAQMAPRPMPQAYGQVPHVNW